MSQNPDTAADVCPTVLDAGALARLHELDPQGQAGLVPRVLRTYVTSLQRLLPQAQAALDAGDAPTLRYVAHTLKSSSYSVGALQLAQACLMLERHLTPPSTLEFGPLAQAMLNEGQRVLWALLPRPDSAT